MQMSGALTKVLPWQCGGNTGNFALYRQAAVENSSGFTNEHAPQGGAFSGDLLDQKSKSPLFPELGGPWLQMTSH